MSLVKNFNSSFENFMSTKIITALIKIEIFFLQFSKLKKNYLFFVVFFNYFIQPAG